MSEVIKRYGINDLDDMLQEQADGDLVSVSHLLSGHVLTDDQRVEWKLVKCEPDEMQIERGREKLTPMTRPYAFQILPAVYRAMIGARK